jgi:TRAP-type mannitol/chloroaromatic compound transport system permease small subunit
MRIILEKATRIIDAFTEWCGIAVAWLTALMIITTCVIVFMRYVLESGSIALQESLSYMHSIVFMLGIAFTLKRGGHVRVDIFYSKFSARTRGYIDLVGAVLLLLPVCLVILLLSVTYVSNSWAIGELSAESSGLPWVYLLKSLLLVMPILLALQGVAELIKVILKLKDPSSLNCDPA